MEHPPQAAGHKLKFSFYGGVLQHVVEPTTPPPPNKVLRARIKQVPTDQGLRSGV